MGQVLEENYTFTNRIIGNTAFMLLDKGIGPDKSNAQSPYIDGSAFSEEMYYHKSQGKNITVKINTPGGRVDQGWSMVDSILENKADTFAAGLAYSMGGICLMCGVNRKAYSHASIMIHAPRGGNKDIIEVVKAQFKTLLESRTKFSKAEIEEMMDSGKDYFFTAKEALKKGIIDEIVETDVTAPTNASTVELYNFYNQHTDESKKPIMEIWNKFFGGKDDGESFGNAVAMKAKNAELEAKNTAQTAEIADLKAKLEAGKAGDVKAKALALVAEGKKAGKITEATEATWLATAESNFDGAKAMLDGIKAAAKVSVAAMIDTAKEKKGGEEDKTTFAYMSKHNPKELDKIRVNEPEVFAKMLEDYSSEALSPYEIHAVK